MNIPKYRNLPSDTILELKDGRRIKIVHSICYEELPPCAACKGTGITLSGDLAKCPFCSSAGNTQDGYAADPHVNTQSKAL